MSNITLGQEAAPGQNTGPVIEAYTTAIELLQAAMKYEIDMIGPLQSKINMAMAYKKGIDEFPYTYDTEYPRIVKLGIIYKKLLSKANKRMEVFTTILNAPEQEPAVTASETVVTVSPDVPAQNADAPVNQPGPTRTFQTSSALDKKINMVPLALTVAAAGVGAYLMFK